VLTWEAKKEAIFEMPVRTRERGRARERYPRARAISALSSGARVSSASRRGDS